MKNRYIVINPIGAILLRCNTVDQANCFIHNHIEKKGKHYQLLMGYVPKWNDYSIRDTEDIMTFDEWKESCKQ